jgi:hypothetical protein
VQFSAEPAMYSNWAKTLSFIIEIRLKIAKQFFNNKKNERKFPLKGFQLKFEDHDLKRLTCIQIIRPDAEYSDWDRMKTEYAEELSLRIKDPSFVSQKDVNYTFNFGRVSFELLVACSENGNTDNRILCVKKSMGIDFLNVGIKSLRNDVKTSLFNITENCKHYLKTTIILNL